MMAGVHFLLLISIVIVLGMTPSGSGGGKKEK
jgi:hypothetical protein